MRLVVTSDLHYNVLRSKEPARKAAEAICGLRAEALLVLGDVAGRDTAILNDCLHLFDRFAGRKLFVAGNHDLWTHPGESSLERFERELPELCREAGFHPLDVEPAVIGDVGLVGTIGWYDFSFRPSRLGVPLRFYREKIAPGAASRLSAYGHLLEETADVPEEALRMGTRWMDGEHVRLPMSDLDFCHYLLERFTGHLDEVAPKCEFIVAGLHHVPFRELVPHNDNPNWAFAGAFLGSELFGEALLQQPKVRYAFCGHTHKRGRVKHGHVECINVGSTYIAKRYEIVDV